MSAHFNNMGSPQVPPYPKLWVHPKWGHWGPSVSSMSAKCVEPVKRMCGGHGPRWVVHRFPIKGGLPLLHVWGESLREQIAKPSRLFAMLMGPAAPIVRVDID